MKNFKSFLKEHPSWDHPENPVGKDITDPVIVAKINALMSACTDGIHKDIGEGAVRQIRSSLAKMGLTFGEVSPMLGEDGKQILQLTLYGGRFGKDTDTPHDQFMEDDGLSNKVEGGLNLCLYYGTDDTNTFSMSAEIKSGS